MRVAEGNKSFLILIVISIFEELFSLMIFQKKDVDSRTNLLELHGIDRYYSLSNYFCRDLSSLTFKRSSIRSGIATIISFDCVIHPES